MYTYVKNTYIYIYIYIILLSPIYIYNFNEYELYIFPNINNHDNIIKDITYRKHCSVITCVNYNYYV